MEKLWSFLNSPNIRFNFSYLLPVSLLLAEKKRLSSLINSRTVWQPFGSTGEFWVFAKFAVEQMDSTQEAKTTQREPLVCRAQFGSVSRSSALCSRQTRLVQRKEYRTETERKSSVMRESTRCGSRLLSLLPSSSSWIENVKIRRLIHKKLCCHFLVGTCLTVSKHTERFLNCFHQKCWGTSLWPCKRHRVPF